MSPNLNSVSITTASVAAERGSNEATRIIAASHFIPFTVKVSEDTPNEPYQWTVSRRRGHTAMYAGIRSLCDLPNTECTLVGWIGRYQDLKGNEHSCESLSVESRANIVKSLEKYNAVPVFVNDDIANGHYEGYSKQILWPLLHYMSWNDSHPMNPEWWQSYKQTNQIFADVISSIYRKGDIVWIHDYHLLLLPEIFHKKHTESTIGLFFHSPFPSSELFRSLPQRKDILNGMLGATSVSFQTYSYARHFLSSCTRVLGLESTPIGVDNHGSLVSIGVFPIGIDVKSVQERRSQPSVLAKVKNMREMFANKRIIVARDRLDEVAGIKQKLEAFEVFLEKYPSWQNNVVLIQVTQPGLTPQPRLETKISELVTSINSNYGSLEFMPIMYHNSFLDTDEYMALLNIADLCLITVIRDGMSTGSLEYVVCQEDKHSPLILSEFTGTAGSVSGAIQINPWDYENVAQAMDTALRMSPEDKKVRYKAMYNHVTSHDAQHWAATVVEDLRSIVRAGQNSSVTPKLNLSLMTRCFTTAKKRLILLDYDGTLTPITNIPSEALPPPGMLQALGEICADPRNLVCIISGRDRQFLDLHLGDVKGLTLSGEHGSFIKYPGDEWVNLLAEMDMGWKDEVMSIFKFYTERTSGSTIEAKENSIAWHYRNTDPEYGEFQAKECMNHLENSVVPKRPVEILAGKKCLEVRPISVNKGEIVKRLMGAQPEQWDFVVCVGDDKTDEDMFRALRTVRQATIGSAGPTKAPNEQPPYYFTIAVGASDKKTAALWHLTSSEKVIEALQTLASAE